MTLAATSLTATAAETKAARNWAANLKALAVTQPELIDRIQPLAAAGEWVFARDGSLTLLSPKGEWIGDCSIPYRAGVAMMKTLEPRGSVGCFLAPLHAGEIKAALEKLTPQQAVIALQPDWTVVRTQLSCEDFSADLLAGRLFFAVGENCLDQLRSIFTKHPGLPTPQQFIKLPTLTNDIAEPLILESQKVFNAVITDRAEQIVALRDTPRKRNTTLKRLGVIAGSKFALWDDAGAALAEALRPVSPELTVTRFDSDSPTTAGPLATAIFCQDCDAIVTADIARCDFPDVLPMDLPWATWVTKGRIPAVVSAGPGDGLIVADPKWLKLATDAGWDARRVTVGMFQHGGLRSIVAQAKASDGWTVIADTVAIATPDRIDDFSSHRVVWEFITAELANDPCSVGDDLAGYLHSRAKKFGVDDTTLDRRQFIESLLLPAYAQGLVRTLMKNGVPVRVFGRGWAEIDEFKRIAAGAIADRTDLTTALASSRRLVHVWPTNGVHPIDATGLPVLRRPLSLVGFLQQARQPEKVLAASPTTPEISLDAILSLLACNFDSAGRG